MTSPLVEEARRLAEAATSGPWMAHGRSIYVENDNDAGEPFILAIAEAYDHEPDAAFIAASRDLLPKLAEENEQLHASLAALSEPLSEAAALRLPPEANQKVTAALHRAGILAEENEALARQLADRSEAFERAAAESVRLESRVEELEGALIESMSLADEALQPSDHSATEAAAGDGE